MRQLCIKQKKRCAVRSTRVAFWHFFGERKTTIEISFLLCVILALIGVSGSSNALADEKHAEFLRQAESAALKYREDSGDSDEKAKLRTHVLALVEKSFEARQTSQRKQLQQMRDQLLKAEAALDRREEIRDRIVERKVEDLLSGQPADWKDTKKSEPLFDVIGVGDTVAIYLPGVIPFNPPNQPPAPPQVNLLQSGRLVTGYPFAVGSDGAISMPLINVIQISGLTVREAEQKISKVYVERDILRPEKSRPTLTLIPKEEAAFSVIDATGVNTATREPKSSVTTGSQVLAGSSETGAFEDTYGRLRRARDLVSRLDAHQRQKESAKDSMGQTVASDKPDKQKSPQEVHRRQLREAAELRKIQAKRAQIETTQKNIEAIKFDLGLEEEYLDDKIEQLRAEVLASETKQQQAFTNLTQVDQLFESGKVTQAALSDARNQWENLKLDTETSRLTLEQYTKISNRWKQLVGERLDTQ